MIQNESPENILLFWNLLGENWKKQFQKYGPGFFGGKIFSCPIFSMYKMQGSNLLTPLFGTFWKVNWTKPLLVGKILLFIL